MTTNPNPTPELRDVTQVDRDAAAQLVSPHGRWPGFASDFRSGRADANQLTQAFAAHRLATPTRSMTDPARNVVEVAQGEVSKTNRWYADAPKQIWLHGIGDSSETTWADDPMPGGEDVEQEHAVGYIRDDLASLAISPEGAREGELREALSDIFEHFKNRAQAPGHDHDISGVWDDDISNREKAGTPCEWCAKWERARSALARTEGGR
jgi:hypothetical protein